MTWSDGVLLKAVAGRLPVPVLQWMWGQGARFNGEDLQDACYLAAMGKGGRLLLGWLQGLDAGLSWMLRGHPLVAGAG